MTVDNLAEWFMEHEPDFWKYCKISEDLTQKTDREIGELLFDHIWSHFDVFSPQVAIVEAAFERLGFVVTEEIDQEHICEECGQPIADSEICPYCDDLNKAITGDLA